MLLNVDISGQHSSRFRVLFNTRNWTHRRINPYSPWRPIDDVVCSQRFYPLPFSSVFQKLDNVC